ncbi:unnamed protein product, partial [Vitis vinifera]|uniref:Uncharacterized protein n=1 Tax=Vitis vinifera TaxID=29760 RepID=D7TKD3_VITVI
MVRFASFTVPPPHPYYHAHYQQAASFSAKTISSRCPDAIIAHYHNLSPFFGFGIIFLLILHLISCCNSNLTLSQPPHNNNFFWIIFNSNRLTPSRLAQKLHGNIPKFGKNTKLKCQ